MKKIVRITESEINNIVKKVLKEEDFITRVGSPLDSIENYVKEKYGIKEHQYIKNSKKFVVEPGNGWGMDIRLQDDYGMWKNHVGGEMFIATYELDYTLQGMEHKYDHGIKKKVKSIEELKRSVDEFFNGGLRREDNIHEGLFDNIKNTFTRDPEKLPDDVLDKRIENYRDSMSDDNYRYFRRLDKEKELREYSRTTSELIKGLIGLMKNRDIQKLYYEEMDDLKNDRQFRGHNISRPLTTVLVRMAKRNDEIGRLINGHEKLINSYFGELVSEYGLKFKQERGPEDIRKEFVETRGKSDFR